jgi:hypothetical protein
MILLPICSSTTNYGNTFTWTLGDIPPQERQVLTVALQVPGTAVDFIDLDLGATASGTLWGIDVSGNARDQSSLLIAMLRAASIPARYRHGTLSTAIAQSLIAEMFPKAPGIAGHVPDGTEVADPLHASALQYEITAAIPDSYYLAESLKSLHDGVEALYDCIPHITQNGTVVKPKEEEQ